jgi:hypothetical protein
MTYEFLMTIALLCQHSASISTGSKQTEYRDTKADQAQCQIGLIKCAGDKPTPKALSECVKYGATH